MLNFIYNNPAIVITLSVLAFIVFLAIRRLVKDKKEGIGACGQKCSNCPHSANCHHN